MQRIAQLTGVALAILGGAGVASTEAAEDVVWVSTFGTDNSTCGPANAPCRTFQKGVDRAPAGATVNLSIAGDYGPATITKDLVVKAVKGAGVFSPAKPCITVGGTLRVHVAINELTCDLGGAAHDGVSHRNAILYLDNVIIRGGTGTACGVRSQGPTVIDYVVISDSIISDFANAGVCAQTGTNEARVDLERVKLESNHYGVLAAVSGSKGFVLVFLKDTLVTLNSAAGIRSTGVGSQVGLANSTITINVVGLQHTSGGTIASWGGNSVTLNTTNGTFTDVFMIE